MFQVAARFLARMDDARHRATRSAFTGVFSPRRIEQYRTDITQTANKLIDAFPAQGPVDVVTFFARPLPFTIICRVLGVPADNHQWLGDRMDTFGRGVAGQRERANVEAGNAATLEMLALFDDLLAQRRAEPTDDLLSLLAVSGHHDRQDVLANCIFFVLAGHATTTALITAGVQLLSAHPNELTSALNGSIAWADVVEELLRYVSPTTLTGVTATQDLQIAACPVPRGANRAIVFAAANRDASVFTNPDKFDSSRNPNNHIAFSAGRHYCLGAPLARLHGVIALRLLFSRLTGLRAIDDPEWLGSVPIRQAARLNATWNPL